MIISGFVLPWREEGDCENFQTAPFQGFVACSGGGRPQCRPKKQSKLRAARRVPAPVDFSKSSFAQHSRQQVNARDRDRFWSADRLPGDTIKPFCKLNAAKNWSATAKI